MIILLNNISKDLRRIFFEYISNIGKKNEVTVHHPNPYYGSSGNINIPPNRGYSSFDGDFRGVIYFYEWSDINRTPRTFYTLKAFEKFLNDSQIYLVGWQREVITNLPNRYITCKKGSKELIIKCGYESLRREVEEIMKKEGETSVEPYSVAITRPPSMRHATTMCEVESRYPEYGEQEFWEW